MRFSCQNNNNNKSSFLLNTCKLFKGSNIECEEGVGAFFLDFDEVRVESNLASITNMDTMRL